MAYTTGVWQVISSKIGGCVVDVCRRGVKARTSNDLYKWETEENTILTLVEL